MKAPSFARTALRRSAAILFCLVALGSVASPQAPAAAPDAQQATLQQDRVVAGLDPAKFVRLPAKLPAWVQPARSVGSPSPDLQLDHLTILLARSPAREQAFRQLLEDQQNRTSPQYHRWLTPAKIGQRYGLTDHDIEAVEGWLQANNLRVEQVSKSRTVIRFSGSVAAVEAALAVHFNRYAIPTDQAAAGAPTQRLSINTAPRLPAALAPVIQAFGGLTQIPVHPYGHAEVMPMSVLPQFSNCNSNGSCRHFITPADFATIFNLTAPAFSSANSDQRIAIIGRSRVDPQDLSYFSTSTGGFNYEPNILIPPGGIEPGTTNDGDQLEATIDLTRALATAPFANADLIISADSQTVDGIYLASLYEVDTVLDPIMNISFGACEADAGAGGVAFYDNLASQAAGEGISIFVSSGDAGAAGCDRNNDTPPVTQVESPNYICSSSYVTCVGGTEFNDQADPAQYWSTTNTGSLGSALSYIPEGGWNQPTFTTSTGATGYQASASGGGVSSIIPKPAWQTGPGVPADGFRDTPDMAFPASGHDGYFACLAFIGADCSKGYFAYIFGTSAAAPSMAGITAALDGQRSSPLGNLNPILYAIAADPTKLALHDTTVLSSGVAGCSLTTPSLCNNSTPSSTALTGGLQGYALTAGYDLVTGLGSLDADNFLNAAVPPLLTPTLVVSQDVLEVAANQTFSLQASVTGSGPVPSGTLTWFQFDTYNLVTDPAALVNGTATTAGVLLPSGNLYSLGALYSGDANYAPARSNYAAIQQVNVAPGSAALYPSFLLTSNPTTVLVGQSVVIIATVQGNGSVPTGLVQFYNPTGTLLGPPVSLQNGVATSLPAVFLQSPDGAGFSAQYFGDSQYHGAPSLNQIFVQPLPAPAFQVSATSLSVTAGQTTNNTSTITVASQNYNDTINFTCSVAYAGQGTPTHLPVCTLSTPAALTLSATTSTGTLLATLATVAPTVGAAALATSQPFKRKMPPFGKAVAAIAGVLCLAFPPRAGKRGVFSASFFLVLLLGTLAASAIGCGGGSTSTPITPTPPINPIIPGTTTGNYTVTVTGSSHTFTSTASFTLTVDSM